MTIVSALYRDSIHSVLWFLNLRELAIIQSSCRFFHASVQSLRPQGEQRLRLKRRPFGPEVDMYVSEIRRSSCLWSHVTHVEVSADVVTGSFSDALETFLAHCKHLSTLWFDALSTDCIDNTEALDGMSRSLVSVPQLQSLSVSYIGLSDKSGVAFANALGPLKNLHTLSLSNNRYISSEVLSAMAHATRNLTSLDMSACWCGGILTNPPVSLTSLVSANVHLSCLALESVLISDIHLLPAAIASLRHLTHLALVECVEYDDNPFASVLASAIATCTQVTHLNLSRNGFSVSALGIISHAITCITALHYLNLSSNFCRFRRGWYGCAYSFHHNAACGEGTVFVDAILPALTSAGPTLNALHLCSIYFGNVGAIALAPALTAMTHLKYLGISDNAIGTRGAKILTDSLAPSCKHLVGQCLSAQHLVDQDLLMQSHNSIVRM